MFFGDNDVDQIRIWGSILIPLIEFLVFVGKVAIVYFAASLFYKKHIKSSKKDD
ncbi:hypothetical protein JOE21_001024 [Desmospora profundinema]|uniref:Uncharacterized protein n=1 Tax=Desmospora profundinema TaxID=1571184 RepID=A0ABU1IKU7_9BACL|nr:hypothetical protein [Desmospora profundinema]